MDFFKPNITKILIFIVLIIVAVLITGTLKIYPCKIRAFVPNPPEFRDDLCLSPIPIFAVAGAQIVYYPSAYLICFILILLIPYIISCTLGELLKKKKQ